MTNECCNTCKYKLNIRQYDYSNGGCRHKSVHGFACMCFQQEGTVIWMYGSDPNIGICEDYEAKEE